MLQGWVVDEGLRTFSCKREGGRQQLNIHVGAAGEGDVSQQLVVRFKNVNSDVRSGWGSQENWPIF